MMECNGWTLPEYEIDEIMIQYMNDYPLVKDFDVWHGSLWKILKNNYLDGAGGVGIDCGASYGWFTIPMSQHFNTVHSFEIRKDVSFCLERNLEHCGIQNVKIWNNAVYDVDGIDVWYDEDVHITGFTCITRIDPNISNDDVDVSQGISISGHGGFDTPHVNIKTRSIDSMALDDVRFIKLDIEGAEHDALCGASLTIERCRPVIMFEVHTQRTEESYEHRQKLFKFMQEHNYQLADAVRSDYIFTAI